MSTQVASQRVTRQTYVVTADQVKGILHDAARRRLDPLDPRGTRMLGGYPVLGASSPLNLPRLLYRHVGVFRQIVDKPAADIWSKGWEIITDDKAMAERAERLDRKARAKQAFKDATRYARRDGKAVLRYLLRDNTGLPHQPPSGVRALEAIKAHPCDVIAKTHYDAHGNPTAYDLRLSVPGKAQPETVTYHASRIKIVIQHPDDDHEDEGVSALTWHIPDSQGMENVKWAAAESYYRYGAPLYAVAVDKETDFDPEKDGPELDEKLDDLQNNLTQKVWFKGAQITAIGGSSQINSPEPYYKMFMDSLAGGSGIPKRELTGSEAGAMASASWDEKRYFSFITNDQEDFALPLIEDHYRSLEAWGLLEGFESGVKWIRFPPHVALSETEQADILVKVASSLKGFASVGLPAPAEVAGLVTFPESFDMTQPLRMAAPALPAFGPAGQDAARKAPRQDLRIEVSEELRRIEDKFQRGVLKVFNAWRAQAEDSLFRGVLESSRTAKRALAGDALKRDSIAELLNIRFGDEALQAIMLDFLFESADLGILRTWQELNLEGEVLRLVNTTSHNVFQEYASRWSRDKAEAMTQRVRQAIADAISNPETSSLHAIRKTLRETFGTLDNAAVIARTESMRGFNRGRFEAMRQGGVKEWEFLTFDAACPICVPLNKQKFPISDDSNLPPEGTHPNCRCTGVAVIPEVFTV